MSRRARRARATRLPFAFLQGRLPARAFNLNVLTIAFASMVFTAYARADNVPPVIESQGHGEVLAKPDAAIITLSVVSKGDTAQAAARRNAATEKAIAGALLAKGLIGKDAIGTSESSIRSIPKPGLREVKPRWHALGGFNAEFPADENVLLSLMDTVAARSWTHVMDDSTRNGKSTLGLQVYGEGGSAKEAAADGNEHVAKMINLVKARVPGAKITRFDLRIMAPQGGSPFQREEPEAPYTARNELSVRAASMANVPRVVDEAMAAGADGVSYVNVNLVLRDPAKAQTEAIYQATKDAKLKAQAEAAALGVKLGPLLKSSVTEPCENKQDYYRGNRQMASYGQGDTHVSADVTLTYAIR
jgi:uncharacterized protein YggE